MQKRRQMKAAASPAQVIDGFLNISTGQHANCDTEVSLRRDGGDLVIQAQCRCDAAGVSANDRLVVTFDPVGRDADTISVEVAPDGTVVTNQLGTAFPHTRAAWGAEPYPIPARVEASLTLDGWRVALRLPLAAMFALRGGAVPASFRLNIGRNWDNREWSYWPLANATFGEFVPGFAKVNVEGSGLGVQAAEEAGRPDSRNRQSQIRNLKFVGLMYDTSRAGKIYDVETFVKFVDWLAVCGCTHFMLYFENGFRFQKHPAFAAPQALDAAGVRRIDAACRERGVELILSQTSFGHMPGILSHPDYIRLAEDGDPWQLCPSHPDTYAFLGDLLDELIPLSSSNYFNVNCDESRVIGRCPRCRQRGATALGKEQIFLDHLLWLHEKVGRHGKRMMVWSDHLLRMPLLVEKLPRDIVVLDWQYYNWATFPTLAYLKDQGFEVIGCPFNRYDNIRPMTLDCRRRGMVGVLDTIWEMGDGGLGLAAPGIYLMGKLAQGDPAASDEVLFAECEELIWPGNSPGIAWKMLIDHNGSLTPKLREKLKADTARALRRAVPAPRFDWIAEQLRRLMGDA
jgi:hypothetical protein